ncbi:hypothetical protein [Variovorax gossypii]
MAPFQLDLAQITSTKLESLREAFEATLSNSLRDEPGLGAAPLDLILERTPEGPYVHPAIDGAWNGFQWGGDHVRALVRRTLDRLDSAQQGDVQRDATGARDPARPNAAVVNASFDPTRENEKIDWSLPLYDSDGFQHALVGLGGVQAVTRHAFVFVVWDRRSLKLVNDPGLAGEPPLSLGNTPMTDEERSRRRALALNALRQRHELEEAPEADAPRG